MIKPHNVFPYVRHRTIRRGITYVRQRTFAFAGVATTVILASCSSSSVVHPTSHGLVSIQSAVTCPAPPLHSAVLAPPRTFAATPRLTLGHAVGYCAYIDTTRGIISVRLRPEYAPHAVSDFIYLARQGFYDGLRFYEVCPAATGGTCPAAPIALTGDPTGTGAGGPGYSVDSDPVIGAYLLGAVAMYGSNASVIGSRFFLSKGDSQSLARKYDIFGEVTDGIPALVELQTGDIIHWIAIVATAPEP